ncbi:MAG TPA: hypothetical protein VL020_01800 [Pseudomonadales bacterium]|nr:hypothetical protein [Pseudomonadales bacterium]
MNIEDLDTNTTLKLVGLVPLELIGNCNGHNLTILEVSDGYQLTGSDNFNETYTTLKEAIQQCYLTWGE